MFCNYYSIFNVRVALDNIYKILRFELYIENNRKLKLNLDVYTRYLVPTEQFYYFFYVLFGRKLLDMS